MFKKLKELLKVPIYYKETYNMVCNDIVDIIHTEGNKDNAFDFIAKNSDEDFRDHIADLYNRKYS